MIRTSKHYFFEPNKNKQTKLNEFLTQYRNATQYFVNYIWENLVNESFDSPKRISTKEHKYKDLSQRALKCSATQACSIIQGTLDLKRRRTFVLSKLEPNSKEYLKLKELIEKQKVNKPNVNYINCELNSICCDKKDNFIQLKSIGKIFGKIRIPFTFHKQANKWKRKGKLLNSFLISNNWIDLRWNIEVKPKSKGQTLGLDQGKITVVSLSDGQTTKANKDNYDLNKIQTILARRTKGSKRFRKAQEHRKNYINWSINQLNFDKVKKVKIEEIKDLRKGKRCNRNMSHWTYTLINSKLINLLEELGVQVTFNKSSYRSQRCSQCGFVLKSNRKNKTFCCKNCGYVDDSDINAAKNHEADLPFLPLDLSRVGLDNVKLGFFWQPNDLFVSQR